jgi:hypothetical protein
MEYITEISDGIPKIVCQEIIEKFENDFIIDIHRLARFQQTPNTDSIIGMAASLDESVGWEVECAHLHQVLMKNLYEYIDMLQINIFEDKKNVIDEILSGPKIGRTTFKIQKIGVNDPCDWHIDYSHEMDRILNFIIYLNENESCTEFLNGRKIKPQFGKIAFFPSTWTYTHRCQPIKQGYKYVLTGFIFCKN